MGRPIWKGNISFGLVSVPVALHSAEKHKAEIKFNFLDKRDHTRIRNERVNEKTGEAVPWNDVVRGYEYSKNKYVTISDEDFKKAAVKASQTIEIEAFVDAPEVGVMFFEKPYYVLPDKDNNKSYVLLREAIKRSGKIGIAKIVMRQKQHLVALMVQDNALVIEMMRFADELVSADELEIPDKSPTHYNVTAKEIELAEQLVKAMTDEFKPEKYHDAYREQLKKWIDKKVAAGGEEIEPDEEEETEEPGRIINIMELLKKSVESGGKKTTASEAKHAKRKPAGRKKTA